MEPEASCPVEGLAELAALVVSAALVVLVELAALVVLAALVGLCQVGFSLVLPVSD